MKPLGFLLLVVGFVFAALQSVWRPGDFVQWTLYVPGLIVGIGGVVLLRLQARAAARDDTRVAEDVRTLGTSIETVTECVGRLDRDKASLDVYDLPARIDAEARDALNAFADARASIVPRFGVGAYAEVMNHFAAGERYLNRVWSASIDGYVDEAHEYLGRAREQFEITRERIAALGAGS